LNIYYSLHQRDQRRGKNPDVPSYQVIAADLDAGPGKPYPDAEMALYAYEYAETQGTVPAASIAVQTGNGIHLYWLLKEPIPATAEGTALYQSIMGGIREALCGDGIADAARILRLPGFDNVKGPDPKETSIDFLRTDLRYTPADFPLATSAPRTYEDVDLPKEIDGQLKAVCDAMKAAGWSLRPLSSHEGIQGVEVRGPCPICHGQPEKYRTAQLHKAHIAPRSLNLKCKHASCTAYEGNGGLPLQVWAQLVGIEFADEAPALPTIALDEVPAHFRAAFDKCGEQWLAGRIGVLQLPTGAGKTYEAMAALAKYVDDGEGVWLALPSNALAAEKYAEFRDNFPHLDVVLAVSMAQGCSEYPLREWHRRLPNIEQRACNHKCASRDTCTAHTWKDQHKAHNGRCLVICTHHMLGKIKDLPGPAPAAIVVDEFPATLLDRHVWTATDIENMKRPRHGHSEWTHERRHAAEFFARILSYCNDNHATLTDKYATRSERAYGFSLHGDALREVVAEVCGNFETPLDEVLAYQRNGTPKCPPSWDMRVTDTVDEFPPLDFDCLTDGFGDCGVWIPGDSDSGELRHAHFRLLDFVKIDTPAGVPVVILDATGMATATMLERGYDRPVVVEAIDIPQPHVRTVWCHTTSYGARRLATAPGRVKTAAKKDLIDIVKHAPDARYGVIGTQKFVKRVLPDVRPTVKQVCGDFDCPVDLYYGNTKGTNALQDVDALVLFGSYLPNLGVSEYEAWRLGMDAADYIDGVGNAEMVQSIGRARGVRRTADNPLTIYAVGTYRPPGNVDEVRIAKAGPAPKPQTIALDAVLEDLLDRYGYLTTSMITVDIPQGRLEQGSGHYWQLLTEYICQLCPNAGAEPVSDRLRKWVQRTIGDFADQRKLVKRHVANAARTARMVVYEVEPGAYDEWLETSGRESTEADPLPVPVVAVDIPIVLNLDDGYFYADIDPPERLFEAPTDVAMYRDGIRCEPQPGGLLSRQRRGE